MTTGGDLVVLSLPRENDSSPQCEWWSVFMVNKSSETQQQLQKKRGSATHWEKNTECQMITFVPSLTPLYLSLSPIIIQYYIFHFMFFCYLRMPFFDELSIGADARNMKLLKTEARILIFSKKLASRQRTWGDKENGETYPQIHVLSSRTPLDRSGIVDLPRFGSIGI